MRGLHAASRQLDLIAGRIADTLQEMKLNQVGSPKSHRLLKKESSIRSAALNCRSRQRTPRRASVAIGDGLEAGRRIQRRPAACTASVVTGMKNILEQMSQWESFVDVVNQVAEVIKMEQNVLEAAEKARESRTQEVFDGKP